MLTTTPAKITDRISAKAAIGFFRENLHPLSKRMEVAVTGRLQPCSVLCNAGAVTRSKINCCFNNRYWRISTSRYVPHWIPIQSSALFFTAGGAQTIREVQRSSMHIIRSWRSGGEAWWLLMAVERCWWLVKLTSERNVFMRSAYHNRLQHSGRLKGSLKAGTGRMSFLGHFF